MALIIFEIASGIFLLTDIGTIRVVAIGIIGILPVIQAALGIRPGGRQQYHDPQQYKQRRFETGAFPFLCLQIHFILSLPGGRFRLL